MEYQGTLVSKPSSGFNSTYIVDDGSGEAALYIDGTTGIDQSILDANIGGVVQVKGASQCTGTTIRLLPRMDSDIVIVSPPPPPPEVSCTAVHTTPSGNGCAPSDLAGEVVTTYGVVYVPAGTYNGGSVYYQCDDGGLLFFENGAPYALGDEIKVTGSVGAFGDEIQINGAVVEVLSSGNTPMANYLPTGVLAEGGDFLGDFVELQGTLLEKTSSGFNDSYLIDDGSGPVVMFVDGTTGIDEDRVDSFIGRTIRVRGATKCYNDEGEILPRFDADIEGVSVPFDIKPGSCENPFNMKVAGVLPVAILGSADLDVANIDPASLRLEGVKAKMTALEHVMDATGSACDPACAPLPSDDYMDLVAKFAAASVAEALYGTSIGEPIPLRLTGNFLDGRPFDAVDCVQIVGWVPEGGLDKGPEAPKFAPASSPRAPVQTVNYSVPEETRVRLQVFSITGRLVETVIDRMELPGDHIASWDASRHPSGVYFYRYQAGSFIENKKLVLVH
jgi:hypothetical protein